MFFEFFKFWMKNWFFVSYYYQIGWLNDVAPEVLKNVEIIQGDIRDAERIQLAVADCEYVFHLSSLIAIPYSYVAARSYVDTNMFTEEDAALASTFDADDFLLLLLLVS